MISSYAISCKPSCLPKQGLKPLRGIAKGYLLPCQLAFPYFGTT